LQLPYSDNTYDLRAVAVCVDPSTGSTLAETATDVASGVIDMVRPTVFGTPQPSDGILSAGDDISIQFNENIAQGIITSNNISVTGVKNGSNTIHTASVHFDGESSKMLIEQPVNLSDKSFTFECWLKRNQLKKGVILSHAETNGLEFGFDSNNHLYVKHGSVIATSSNTYTDMVTWNHYAMVYDNSTQKVSVYVNGDFAISDVALGSYNETGMLQIGVSCSGSDYLAADVHELRAWETALTQGTISANKSINYSGTEEGLIGYWPMNEAKGSVATDKSRGRNGALSATWAFTPSGKSVSFNGVNSDVTLNTSTLSIVKASDYTIEMWFKGETQTNACLFSAGRGDGNEYGNSTNNAAIWFDANGLLNFANNAQVVQVSNAAYLDNQWHHLAVCVNRASGSNIYVDGSLVKSLSATNLTAITAAYMYLGKRCYMNKSKYNDYISDMPFKGEIDEFRIWNKNLSKSIVAQNMNTHLSGDETGLAAYYPFDAYSGSELAFTASDQLSDSKNVAVLNNATSSNEYAPVKITGNVEKLGFSYVTNDNTIVITLTDQNADIERTSVTVSVDKIQDLHENVMASPVSWNVYVDKSQLKWDDASFTFNKVVNADLSFSNRIVNTSGQALDYHIDNLPEWLSAEPSSGIIEASSSQEITFTVDNQLNTGLYDEVVYLRSEYNEPLAINMNVLSELPDWSVDASKFSASMNIVATLSINDIYSTDKNDKVAVFIDGVCCGVAQPVYYSAYDKYFVYLKVYGNESSLNKTLSFRVFDASSGIIYSGTPASPITFVNNDLQGLPSAPVLISAKNEKYQITALNEGWTWISFNVATTNLASSQSALSGLTASSGDVIKNNALGVFDAYSADAAVWKGSLTNNGGLNNTSMYMLKTAQAQSLSLAGTTIDPSTVTFTVNGGKWNYISYLPANNLSVKEALAGYSPSANDVLKSQDAFSVYDPLLGWTGDLKYMQPGMGYMLYRSNSSNAQFIYPKNTLSKKAYQSQPENAKLTAGKYAETMNVIACVKSDFGFEANDWILGYNNDELVSATQLSDAGNNRVFVSIQAENSDVVRFELERNNQIIAQSDEKVSFASDAVIGSIASPMSLNFKKLSGEISLSTYPNPVENELMIQMNVAENQKIEISILNVLGNTVWQSKGLYSDSNSFTTTISTSQLTSGVYLLKVNVDGKVFLRKLVKK
jgi:hypothetical protein